MEDNTLLSINVGLIGLGFMGTAISGHLIDGDFSVCGYDIDPSRIGLLVARGGKAASSSGEVAARSDVVLTLLPSETAFEEVVRGPAGLLETKKSGLIVMECSTLPVELKQTVCEDMNKIGMSLLDCPISGGARAAEKDLVVYGSGDPGAYQKCLPVIQSFSRAHYYLGVFGNGSRMKYIANLLVAIHNVSSAEALVFGIRSGLDPELVYKAICDSSGRSRMFEVRGPRMLKGDFDQASMKVGVFEKDLKIIENFAARIHCPTPLFSCAARVYRAALEEGRGHQDTASVFAVLDQWARDGSNQTGAK